MLNLRHCWPAVSHLGYAGYPNYIAGVVGFFTAILLGSGYCMHKLLPVTASACKVVFSAPYPSVL